MISVQAIISVANMVYTDFDSVLRDVGDFGPYQIYNIILIGLSGTPAGAHSLANVFLAGTPDHWCADASAESVNSSTPATVRNVTLSWLQVKSSSSLFFIQYKD